MIVSCGIIFIKDNDFKAYFFFFSAMDFYFEGLLKSTRLMQCRMIMMLVINISVSIPNGEEVNKGQKLLTVNGV